MIDKTFIFSLSTSVLVPQTNRKPYNMFIYSAKQLEEFYITENIVPRPVYGKFSIANDNNSLETSTPPYYIC